MEDEIGKLFFENDEALHHEMKRFSELLQLCYT